MIRYSWILTLFLFACTNGGGVEEDTVQTPQDTTFQWQVDQFADLRILRYQIPDFEELSLQQKKLVYFLTQAGLSGRDIMYDMNYRHNLEIRKAFEEIVSSYAGDKQSTDWTNFMIYAKRFWFSNGIHHHYGNQKFRPAFDRPYLESLLSATAATLSDEALDGIFDPEKDAKKVSLDASRDLLLASAINFYDPDVTEAEAVAFYKQLAVNAGPQPISHGLNSRLARDDQGKLTEQVYHVNGLYGPAIEKIISWLEKAVEVAENEQQATALKLLIKYYQTGDLKIWDDYNIAWVDATDGDVDYIQGFVEVYNDPLGYKGSFENIVQIKDFAASKQMEVLSSNAQWFEDQAPIMDKHKKEDVVGISYKVINVAGESGDASPSTPIGVNLPNANWIRAKHGSKSVSLGNIIDAYDQASGPSLLREFAHDDEEIARLEAHSQLASKLSTALHEVIGHASGKLEPGVGTPKETLKNYASTLEEARADIVALYYIMDSKMVELGLMPSMEVGKAEYDAFISNGLMKQLRRLEMGDQIEEAHMRNRQLISAWAYEKGKDAKVIEKITRDGKTFYNINDYDALRNIFGDLFKELQRIKSQGDFAAGQALVENYGVKVDPDLHQEVLNRVKEMNIAPYGGFINPELKSVLNDQGEITHINVEYPTDFVQQMLDYGKKHAHL
ncbi:MAG: dihydrofolate reductase [Saprospiraceae bacterium]|nr:dihydrofolate reductase [Saprospiraceae bacterium]